MNTIKACIVSFHHIQLFYYSRVHFGSERGEPDVVRPKSYYYVVIELI